MKKILSIITISLFLFLLSCNSLNNEKHDCEKNHNDSILETQIDSIGIVTATNTDGEILIIR